MSDRDFDKFLEEIGSIDYFNIWFFIWVGLKLESIPNKVGFGITFLHLSLNDFAEKDPTINRKLFFYLIANGLNPYTEDYLDQTPYDWESR